MEFVLDSHTHTIVSGHAYNTITEMAKAASEKGLSLLGITEHAERMPGSCKNIYFANLKILPRSFFGIYVLFGTEANILDSSGSLDIDDDLLSRLDVVIASMHLPCYPPGSRLENTDAAIGAIRNPRVCILGHPDDGRYPVDAEAIVQAAKEHHVLIELNEHSLAPGCARENARENDIEILKYCKKHQAPIIVDSDAHFCFYIGQFDRARALLEEVDFPEELIVNRSLQEYLTYLPEIARERMRRDS